MANFDISVRSTTQQSFISSFTSFVGMAAAAGEIAKDKKDLAAVKKVGSDFIPSVVKLLKYETFCFTSHN